MYLPALPAYLHLRPSAVATPRYPRGAPGWARGGRCQQEGAQCSLAYRRAPLGGARTKSPQADGAARLAICAGGVP